ncbi:MAG TPA: serine hydrolase domain-containing protein, partial [Pyrinomonadaceae bacterium]|nr:serine hydrolase domain-containing protein [Pyrinomonadaceae bacterium]
MEFKTMTHRNYLLLTAAVLFFIVPSCVAQTQFPDTPAATQAKAWLEVFNAGDAEKHKEFLRKNAPTRLDRADREMRFREMTGGFDLKKVEESTPTKVVALVQERASDQFARLTVEVDASEQHLITALALQATARPSEFALPHLNETELTTALRKRLDEFAAADRFSGAVLVARNGKTAFAQAYGLADREKKIPNTLKTRFRIGSMNKMFTAVATLQLVQSGKLDLKAPFGKYLTDYPNKDVASKVTVEQLLSHTGGTGDIFGPEFEKNRLELKTLQDYVKLYGNRALGHEPGARWQYSNYGFLLLGVLIEKVSGQSYYDYVRDHIFKPAGMTGTASEPEDQTVAERSVGYTKFTGASLQPNTDTLPYRGTSAGGGYSTVEDLFKFATALQTNKLLNAKYTEELTTGKVDAGRGKYAYGFQDSMVNGTRCFGHGGGAPGMNGMLQICPSNGYVIAILSNLDPPAASRVADFITNRLPA